MSKDYVLSISVAAYNAENCLERCLKSFLVPDIQDDLQVIIVNDGSKDRTREIAESYAAKFPNLFFVINKENGGHGSTINTSIEFAKGKYFKVVDADDCVEEHGFRMLVKALKKGETDVVISPYYEIYPSHNIKILKDIYLKETILQFDKQLSIQEVNADFKLAMAGLTYRTKLLKQNKYRLDEHCFYVDVEYSIFYMQSVKTILFLRDPVYDYYKGNSNQSTAIENMLLKRAQHLTVCKRLISFYEEERISMNESNRNLLKTNIINMITITEYNLLLSISDDQNSYNELISFDDYLKHTSIDLYNHLKEVARMRKLNRIKFICFMRKIHFWGYPILHRVLYSKLRLK